MGVFATRSPFRPNPIGLSCVKLVDVQIDPVLGPVMYVAGADLMNGTPIYDIKPYLPYADCCPEASGGFTDAVQRKTLTVICPEECLAKLPEKSRTTLPAILAQDPRPSYQEDPDRIYGFTYAEHEVKFKVEKDILTVISIE